MARRRAPTAASKWRPKRPTFKTVSREYPRDWVSLRPIDGRRKRGTWKQFLRGRLALYEQRVHHQRRALVAAR